MIKSEKELSVSQVERALKKQKMIFAFLNNSTRKDASYQNYYLPLKKLFGKVIIFDPLRAMAISGKNQMEEKFISLIKREKPDYIFIDSRGNELTIDFLERIRKISPDTKIISYTGDDDKDFENLKRYHALFMDCTITAQPHFLGKYHHDGVRNVCSSFGINTKVFRPMDTKKIYDVTFIGKASKERVKTIEFLIKNRVNLKVFGGLWDNYPKLKNFCMGHLSSDEMPKVINQTKINIGLSKNKYGTPAFKWRIFEISSCRAFSLTDYFGEYLKLFKNNKEIVMFRDERDLLKKINYYLEHEKEREKIAANIYKRTIKNYDVSDDFKKIFEQIMENPEMFLQKFPQIKGKVVTLTKMDMKKTDEDIKKIVGGFDYISFSDGNSLPLKHKDYLQAYSLEKTGKKVSCCDYYVYDRVLGDYLTTNTFRAYEILRTDKFNQIISINQITVLKDYFIRNIDKFRSLFSGKTASIVQEENTCFISIPLVRNKKINKMNSETFLHLFHQKNFIFDMSLLLRQKKLFTTPYLYRLIYVSMRNPPLVSFFMGAIKEKMGRYLGR